MKTKLSSLMANTAADTDGDWIDSIAFPGVRWLLRSLHYPPFATARDLLLQRLARQYGRKPVPPEVMSEEFGGLYAKHLLLGWDGLDEIYSAAKASETLSDPAFREMVSDIEACAGQVGRAQVEFLEETAKNSAAPSATRSSARA